jgi:capsule polysaccharide export protein KpsE/RkpR
MSESSSTDVGDIQVTTPADDAPDQGSVQLSIDDVLIELQEQISSLSSQLAMARAQIRGLNREIEALRQAKQDSRDSAAAKADHSG